ncbi:ATPase [Vibrio cholerae]
MARLFDVVKEMSGQSASISIPRPYIKFCEGNHTHAAVLNQLVFWSSTKPSGEWFYKANDELAYELCLTVDQVRYAIRQLKKRLGDVIQSQVKKANSVPTTHYLIDGDRLVDLLFPEVEQNSQMDSVKLPDGNGNITETIREDSQNHGNGNITDSINRSKPYTNKQISDVPSELETEKPTDPVLFEIPLKGKGTVHQVTQSELFELRDLYPAVDIAQQMRKMIGWCKGNPTRQKTKQGINRFIHNWLSGEQDKAHPAHPHQASATQAPDEIHKFKHEVALLESELNSENQRMLQLIDAKRPQHEVDPSKNRIAKLSVQRRELLEKIANLEGN